MKGTIFSVVTSCISIVVNRRFEGAYRLHHPRLKVSQARNQQKQVAIQD
jgi:hypothetical protein